MHKINDNNYTEWVNRFLDAETTVAEERELYAYFSQTVLPKGAEQYREMFGWYESMPAQTSASSTPQPARTPLRILPLRPWQWAGIAAMIAILFTIGLNMRNQLDGTYGDDGYIYAGYIIRDGKKITDPDIVLPEFDRMSSELHGHIASMDERLDGYRTVMFDDVSSSYDMDNPDIRSIVESALNF